MAWLMANVDISDLSTKELVGELQRRHITDIETEEPDEIIKRLTRLGAPDEALEPLRRWSLPPLLTKRELDAWIKWAAA